MSRQFVSTECLMVIARALVIIIFADSQECATAVMAKGSMPASVTCFICIQQEFWEERALFAAPVFPTPMGNCI